MVNLFRFAVAFWLLVVCAACTQPNPENTRQKSADATEQVKQKSKEATAQIKEGAKEVGKDLQAVAEGVKEGWSQDKNALDLNHASRAQLAALPGFSNAIADRVIARRPYQVKHQLVTKGVLSEQQYRAVENRITVK